MEEKSRDKLHKVVMDDCRRAVITGVSDVIAFDLKNVLLETSCGMLAIKGDNLHVSKLSIDKGEIDVDGRIDGMNYTQVGNSSKKGQSLMGRLFK